MKIRRKMPLMLLKGGGWTARSPFSFDSPVSPIFMSIFVFYTFQIKPF